MFYNARDKAASKLDKRLIYQPSVFTELNEPARAILIKIRQKETTRMFQYG